MELSYLAGIIDGEGYVGIIKCTPQKKFRETKPRYKPTIIIVNTNKKLINILNYNFGGSIHERKKVLRTKTTYAFTFHQSTLWDILPKLTYSRVDIVYLYCLGVFYYPFLPLYRLWQLNGINCFLWPQASWQHL